MTRNTAHAHPYETGPVQPPVLTPVPAVPPMLTDSSTGGLRAQLEQLEGNRLRVVTRRDEHTRTIAVHEAEIASIEVELSILDAATDVIRQAIGAPVSLLPLEPEPATEPEWDGTQAPETGVFAAVPDLSPDPDKNLAVLAEQHAAQDKREGGRK